MHLNINFDDFIYNHVPYFVMHYYCECMPLHKATNLNSAAKSHFSFQICVCVCGSIIYKNVIITFSFFLLVTIVISYPVLLLIMKIPQM